MLVVRPATAQDLASYLRIVRELPEFFVGDVPSIVERDLQRHPGWVVVDDHHEVIGFAIAERRSAYSTEILWMAVQADRRAAGHGTMLLDSMLDALRDDGVQLVEVKTLDSSAGYAPYDATRAFWERRGFVQIDTIDPLPGWQPGNPAAVYVAALRPTR